MIYKCDYCKKEFEGNFFKRRFCSKDCSRACYKQIQKDKIKSGILSAYLKTRFDVLTRDNFKCVYCGRSSKDDAVLEIEHIVPSSKNGLNIMDNYITACRECNRGKRDILLTQQQIKKIKSLIPEKIHMETK